MKIAICVDGSQLAEELLIWYCTSFHRPENDVILLHVGEEPKLPSFFCYEEAVFPKKEFAREVEKSKAKSQALETKYQEIAKFHQIDCKFQVMSGGSGSPGEILVKHLNENPVDVVAIGTRGLGTLRRTILGSVSTYLVNHAPVPVLVHRK